MDEVSKEVFENVKRIVYQAVHEVTQIEEKYGDLYAQGVVARFALHEIEEVFLNAEEGEEIAEDLEELDGEAYGPV